MLLARHRTALSGVQTARHGAPRLSRLARPMRHADQHHFSLTIMIELLGRVCEMDLTKDTNRWSLMRKSIFLDQGSNVLSNR